MNILKQSTAATVKLGAFVDDTDGKTPETGLTISQADIRLSKNGGDFAQTNNATGATHDEFGYYDIPLNTTDTGTLGRLRVAVSESGALPVWQDFLVVTANVYDTLCSTDTFDVNVTALAEAVWHESTPGAMNEGINTMGYDLITAADAIKVKTDLIPASPAQAGEYTAAIAAVQADLDNPDQYKADVSALATTAHVQEVEDKVDTIDGIVDDILTDTGTTIPATLGTMGGQLNGYDNQILPGGELYSEIEDIKAKTDNLPADPADDSDIDTAIAAVKSVVDAILVDTGTTLDTNITAILADTNELQTDLVNGGRLDLLIDSIITHLTDIKGAGWTDESLRAIHSIAKDAADYAAAIKTKTDQLAFTVANKVDATATTDTSSIAGDVWTHASRTLTNQGVEATYPAEGDPLIIYRDTTVTISLTGLGDSTGDAGTKIFFTAKENLEDADASSILQLVCTRADPITDPDTDDLLYINKAAPIAADKGTFVFADHTDGTAVVTIAGSAAAYLPIYAATPLYWDVKMVTAAGVSTILSTGSMYIYGTPTRTIA